MHATCYALSGTRAKVWTVSLDYNPIMALALLVSVAFVVINLITDLIYPLIDPRIAR